jgi:drug/metabolite transporter (DMT)-like permease
MTEIVSYLTPILAMAFGIMTALRAHRPMPTRWFAFAMLCASAGAVLALVHQQPSQLSLRIVLGAAALICGISAGVQIERSRSAARHDSQVSA